MAVVKLKIDIGGTVGNEAWTKIERFGEEQGAFFGPEFGSSGPCKHPPEAPHAKGEWRGAEILVASSLIGQYAMSHYLHQERVLDADVEE